MKLTDRPDEAIAQARQALELGERTGQRDVVAHSLNYLGAALLDLGDPGGAAHLRRSAEVAGPRPTTSTPSGPTPTWSRGCTGQGRFRELDQPLAEGLAYAREYGFASHEYNLEAHRCMLLTLRGRWDEAEAGLRRLLAGEDLGVLASFGLSALGRLLARKGDPAAGPCWSGSGTRPPDQLGPGDRPGRDRLGGVGLAGRRRPGRGRAGPGPAGGTAVRGAERYRGELLCHLARCGYPVEVPAGCPPEFASASRATGPARPSCGGRSAPPTSTPWSWPPRAASRSRWRRWRRSTASGPWSPPTRSAGNGAWASPISPAAPGPGPGANPAGLTDRQLEVLRLLAEGLTNAEIADRLGGVGPHRRPPRRRHPGQAERRVALGGARAAADLGA